MSKFAGVLDIKAELLTPLAQVDREAQLKSRTVVLRDIPDDLRSVGLNTVFVDIPIFSSNGLGGMLRRAGTYLIFSKAWDKGYLRKLEEASKGNEGGLKNADVLSLFFLYSVGGGNVMRISDPQGSGEYAKYLAIKEVTSRIPFASLYGMTLYIPSKLIITDLMPSNPVIDLEDREAIYETLRVWADLKDTKDKDKNKEEANKNKLSPFYTYTSRYYNSEVVIVVDDIVKGSVFAKLFLSEESRKRWLKFVGEDKKEREETKSTTANTEAETDDSQDNGGGNKKKQTIQNIIDTYYIPAGSILSGEISTKEPLSLVEYGLLLESLRVLAQQSLVDADGNVYRFAFGSFEKRGFGRVKLSVSRNGINLLIGKSVDANIFGLPDLYINPQDKLESDAVEAFNEWLENMDYETFTLPLRYLEVNDGEKGSKSKKR